MFDVKKGNELMIWQEMKCEGKVGGRAASHPLLATRGQHDTVLTRDSRGDVTDSNLIVVQ